jgi:hypothetical protein
MCLTIHKPLIVINYLRIFFVGFLLSFSIFTDANGAATDNNPQVIVSKTTKKIDGHQYQILSSPNVKSTGIKLLGNSKGIKAINALLLKSYLSEIEDELGCVDTENKGGDWGITYNHSVFSWNKRFVVIGTEYEEYCGQAHGSNGLGGSTFNLITGKHENIDKWFNKSLIDKEYGYFKYISREEINALDEDGVTKSTTILGNLLENIYIKRQQKLVKTAEDKDLMDECVEAVEFGRNFWPTKNGFSFSTYLPYAYRSCNDDVILPYRLAMPFLSKKGKQEIQAFRK